MKPTIYILAAMVATASAGIMSVDFTNPNQVACYALSIIASGLVAAKTYYSVS